MMRSVAFREKGVTMKRWTTMAFGLLLAAATAQGQDPTPKAVKKRMDPELQMGMEHAKTDAPAQIPDALVVVPFRNAADQLGPRGRAVLDRSIAKLNEGTGTLQIAGHTSGAGRPHANQLLSERRAKTVKDYLVDHGVAAERLSTVGFGADQPLDTNATSDGRRRNRRVEIKAGAG
jgi:outer membrane protein OmpA-like peptidoglycan-associated protein